MTFKTRKILGEEYVKHWRENQNQWQLRRRATRSQESSDGKHNGEKCG